jgi:hypothetical protein
LQDAAAEIPPDDSEEEEIEPEKESKYLDLSGWSMIDILDAYNSEPERISPEMHSRIERLLRVRREGELSSEGWMGK